MLSIRPGVTAQHVLTVLEEAVRAAADVAGHSSYAIDLFTAYLVWANEQARLLGAVVGPGELDRLITSRRYWTIQGLDPAAYGMALGNFVRLEIDERRRALETAAKDISYELSVWDGSSPGEGGKPVHAVVLDTNVLMHHHDELKTLDWHGRLELRTDVSVGLAVPLVVVNELDKNKLSGRPMQIRGKNVEVRSLARQALKTLDTLFENGLERVPVGTTDPGGHGVAARIWASLLLDDYDREPLSRPDAEIIDRALALTAFVPRVTVMTYDRGLFFEARRNKIHAHLLQED